VELGGDVAWIAWLFDSTHPPADARREKRARSSPAVEIESELGGEWLADRLVVVTQLAEELDRATLELALRIVPVQWREERLDCSDGLAWTGPPGPLTGNRLVRDTATESRID
jgi:hypothetical protein